MDDQLHMVLVGLWSRLESAAAAGEADDPWRTPALATARLDGAPRVRTVVLRGCDAGRWTLDVHTDRRSGKVGELARNARAAMHIWDARERVQLRLEGHVSLHRGDAEARAAFTRLPPHRRCVYAVMPGPGTPITRPADAGPLLRTASSEQIFVLLRFAAVEVEWLSLAGTPHRRASFRREGDGVDGRFLVP